MNLLHSSWPDGSWASSRRWALKCWGSQSLDVFQIFHHSCCAAEYRPAAAGGAAEAAAGAGAAHAAYVFCRFSHAQHHQPPAHLLVQPSTELPQQAALLKPLQALVLPKRWGRDAMHAALEAALKALQVGSSNRGHQQGYRCIPVLFSC